MAIDARKDPATRDGDLDVVDVAPGAFVADQLGFEADATVAPSTYYAASTRTESDRTVHDREPTPKPSPRSGASPAATVTVLGYDDQLVEVEAVAAVHD